MGKLKRAIILSLYYGILSKLPRAPLPGGKTFEGLRRLAVSQLVANCGEKIIVRNRAYFGDGLRLTIGSNSELGENCRITGTIVIGDDVLMGPDVVIMATSHEYQSLTTPIRLQGEAKEKPIVIGNNVWIGTRSIILPGVSVGDGCIVGAGSVVTKSFPENVIIAGVPAKVVRVRSEISWDEAL